MIELRIASRKQVEYACKNFHYAKLTPSYIVAFSVFENKEWCGCVLYGYGAAVNLHKKYNIIRGKIFELQRMALNGKQSCTSKILALSIKMIKKTCKNIDLLVSYADSKQGHTGVIYQATNWIFEAISYTDEYYVGNKKIHSRGISVYDKSKVKVVKGLPKYKYIYPLNNKIRQQVLPLSKEYPKPAVKAFTDEAPAHQLEKAVDTDLTAQNS
jgi:hypothetical protein